MKLSHTIKYSVMDNNKQTEIYRTYRKAGMSLHAKLTKLIGKSGIMECANLFGMVENGTVYFDEEADMDRLNEFAIHDYYDDNGENTIQKFASSFKYKLSNGIEKNIIQAKLKSKTSLYQVDYVKNENHLVGLVDVFDKYKKIEIIDIGMSQTLKANKSYLFTRIMNFNDFSSTSGVTYLFDKSRYKKIKKEYIKIYKTLPDMKSSSKRSVSFFHVNKLYGRSVKYQ